MGVCKSLLSSGRDEHWQTRRFNLAFMRHKFRASIESPLVLCSCDSLIVPLEGPAFAVLPGH